MKYTLTIESKKAILGGTWCIAGTRVPLFQVSQHLNLHGLAATRRAYPSVVISQAKRNIGGEK